ncbi:MAG: FTR1 family protein [Thermoplasmata archaeon]
MVVAQYLLAFREVLEAALLTAIILAYLVKTGRTSLARYAWYGVYGATGVSIGLGAGIWLVYGNLSQANKVLFEGVAALIAVAVLTSMIYWMAVRARTIRSRVEGRVEAAVTQGAILGLVSLTFVLVFREGLETVLFLTPFLVQDSGATLLGATLGVGAGMTLAYGIFRFGLRLDLRKFFYFTSVLLILLAGGLLGYGIHELIEYGGLRGADFGWWGQLAYALPLASDSLFHHKGVIGSIFAVMFGYTVKAEWARVIAHLAYLVLALPLVILVYRKPEWIELTLARLKAFFRPALAKGRTSPHED